jgi:hypothetical protein
MRAWLLSTLLLVVLAPGCDVYERPNRPVPDSFQAHFLDGAPLDAQTLQGRPWVVALWVPR